MTTHWPLLGPPSALWDDNSAWDDNWAGHSRAGSVTVSLIRHPGRTILVVCSVH